MKRPHILMSLPVAAGAALLLGTSPAAAAPSVAAPQGSTTLASSPWLKPSPIHADFLKGSCYKFVKDPIEVRAMQRINLMWAPIAVDGPKGEGMVLLPNKMGNFVSADPGFRDRHNLTADSYTAPGPAPKAPVVCELHGWAEDAEYDVTITGTLVVLPKWLAALQPPIQGPPDTP